MIKAKPHDKDLGRSCDQAQAHDQWLQSLSQGNETARDTCQPLRLHALDTSAQNNEGTSLLSPATQATLRTCLETNNWAGKLWMKAQPGEEQALGDCLQIPAELCLGHRSRVQSQGEWECFWRVPSFNTT